MSSSAWLNYAYDAVAVLGAFLAIFVMQKTEHDKINMVDAPFLQWVRRFAFVGVSFALCYSVVEKDWVLSVQVLLMVSAGVSNLAINAIALQSRSSTPSGKAQMVPKQYVRHRVPWS